MIVFKPSVGFAASHPAHMIAFGFGAGLSPWAPGTMGTLVAWPFGVLLAGSLAPALQWPLLALLFVTGVWACGVTGRHMGVHDHGGMVWDEIVAFMMIVAILPFSLEWQAAGFIAFRFFDILKPPPIRWFERRYRGGFGVMFDDLLAAGYALLVLALAKRIFF